MINQVEVRSALGQLLTLELDSIANGLFVQSIDGLDPVQATLVSSSFAALDGAQYQSSRRETRNIVITLGLEPDYVTTSVRDLRNNLYRFFIPKALVKLRFFLDNDFVVEIQGRVESFDSVLFSSEPKVVISVVCFDPDFAELDSMVVPGNTVANSTEQLITYGGSVEAGIKLTLLVNRVLEEFTVYHRPGDDIVRVSDFAIDLLADDILTISTITGSKSVILTRSSVSSSVLYAMSPQSNWLELLPGNNYIRVFAEGAPIPFTIEYTPRHGGL